MKEMPSAWHRCRRSRVAEKGRKPTRKEPLEMRLGGPGCDVNATRKRDRRLGRTSSMTCTQAPDPCSHERAQWQPVSARAVAATHPAPCSDLRNFSLMWMRPQLPAPDFSPGIISPCPSAARNEWRAVYKASASTLENNLE